MIYPALSDLLTKVNSRYSLVIATAKRARQIADDNNLPPNIDKDKAVGIAVQEMQDNKLSFIFHDEQFNIYDELIEKTDEQPQEQSEWQGEQDA